MKKFDYLIIVLIIGICTTLFVTYFNNHSIDSNNLVVQVKYKNTVLNEIHVDDTTYVVEVSSNTALDKITVKIKDNYGNEKNSSTITISVVKPISYQLMITKDRVYVNSATCTHRYCMQMNLTPNFTTPIICTDGLTVQYKNNMDITIIA